MDERLRHSRDLTLPALQRAPGWRGLTILVDRDSHKNITIGFWDSEEEMLASEGEEYRAALAQHHFAAGDATVEYFEVGHTD
jgi:hypothetical protein